MLNDRCEPVVLELNDRPSMCVTYEIEHGLKTRVVYDALNVVTVDGEETPEGAKLGGWERLLPGETESSFGKSVVQILQSANQGKQMTAKRLIAKRLGYVPTEGYTQQLYRRSLAILPPLHQ
jgi:hypothetical protein